jgi:hypothetical protein
MKLRPGSPSLTTLSPPAPTWPSASSTPKAGPRRSRVVRAASPDRGGRCRDRSTHSPHPRRRAKRTSPAFRSCRRFRRNATVQHRRRRSGRNATARRYQRSLPERSGIVPRRVPTAPARSCCGVVGWRGPRCQSATSIERRCTAPAQYRSDRADSSTSRSGIRSISKQLSGDLDLRISIITGARGSCPRPIQSPRCTG